MYVYVLREVGVPACSVGYFAARLGSERSSAVRESARSALLNEQGRRDDLKMMVEQVQEDTVVADMPVMSFGSVYGPPKVDLACLRNYLLGHDSLCGCGVASYLPGLQLSRQHPLPSSAQQYRTFSF